MFFWAAKSAWNSEALMVRFLELLAAILGPRLPEWQPSLDIDAATCHLGAELVAEAKSLFGCPANLTWLL